VYTQKFGVAANNWNDDPLVPPSDNVPSLRGLADVPMPPCQGSKA
jgi:hypothetical protein